MKSILKFIFEKEVDDEDVWPHSSLFELESMTYGRWRSKDPVELQRLEELSHEALRVFGYE